MGELLNTEWAAAARRHIERAMDEFNLDNPHPEPLRIIWGDPNCCDPGYWDALPMHLRIQHGLTQMCGKDVEVGVWLSNKGTQACVKFWCLFETPQELDRSVVSIFNNLCEAERGISSLTAVPDFRSNAVLIAGVQIMVPLRWLNGNVLGDILQRLAVDVDSAYKRLTGIGDVKDYWERYLKSDDIDKG
ncbi:MAG: hypothetical protein IAG10_05190 [Planctomycetaceae bacterium]|nr:hypothetical protein [Planctomycetaceae bacterium]